METETTQAVFVPPIDRLDSDTLTGMALTVALFLGFFLYALPAVASGVLIGYGFCACVELIGEVNRRRRIAREIREFRRELSDVQ